MIKQLFLKGIISCLFVMGLATGALSQSSIWDVSFEFQAYPTGLIPGLRIEKGFADRHAVHLRLGYQYIRHRDLGVHGDERGNGYGFTLGYKYFFKENFQGLSLSLRNDIWFNSLDWEDYDDSGLVTDMGTTEITVVQPTVEAGYTLMLGEKWTFTPSLAFGFEVNVKTEGSEVGEGAILLLGFKIGPRF